jgi:ParB family chromosome partitioning protein
MTESRAIQMIPLNKLVPSPTNVRKTAREAEIGELAASIAVHGLLQNLAVCPVLDAKNEETGKFEVVAGGRRLKALKLLAKRKIIARNHPIPCALIGDLAGEEVSLAENVFQCPMHPADQYEAFAMLHAQKNMAVDDIAARFGVTPAVVKQRLKLAAVSPTLLQIYRDGEMSLEQLMAFTITDDHAMQERVWMSLSYNKSREMIRRLLTEGQVPVADRRAKFVGVAAYEAAGGLIIRDLFAEQDQGYFDDPTLLDRLVLEKLEKQAEAVIAEGWKWVMVTPEFNYALTVSMRRIHPEPVVVSDEQQSQIDALEAEYEALSIRHESDEVTDKIEAEFQRLQAAIDVLRGENRYRPEDMAVAGTFVSLGFDGKVRVERGFVRPEDRPHCEPSVGSATAAEHGNGHFDGGLPADDEDEKNGSAALSDRLMTELTTHRTAGLRDTLGENPGVALTVLLHALALCLFYGHRGTTCLEVEARHTTLERHALGITESPVERSVVERHDRWAKRLPKDVADLWRYLLQLNADQRLALLAHCVSLTVNAISLPWERRAGLTEATDQLAEAVGLDMTAYWQPTAANYFGRITKAHILDAVKEAISDQAADRIAGLKKSAMAEAAAQLISGTGWLPSCLRTPNVNIEKELEMSETTCAMAAE